MTKEEGVNESDKEKSASSDSGTDDEDLFYNNRDRGVPLNDRGSSDATQKYLDAKHKRLKN